MGETAVVVIPLYEHGRWVDHELPREIAKQVVADMVKQLSDEKLDWFCRALSAHQLGELAGAARAEMLERERARSQQPDFREGLKLLGE